jgi:fumarate hydratase subunit alpha
MPASVVISSEDVTDAVADLYSRINTDLREDVRCALRQALESETSEVARGVLKTLLENDARSRETGVPLCQDTGIAVAFVRMGQQVLLEGATLQEAVDEGVRRAARDHPLRKSTVQDPLSRENRGDNTPAIVHVEPVPGAALEIGLMAKGGGAENMSRVCMLAPGQGRDGVIEAVLETIRTAGANPCPPVIVGVGLGGNFERSAYLAKRALMRDLREPNPDAALNELEAEMLGRINALGIGPQGLGGRTTALAVLVESAPCHIASLPLAVNVECHSHRHGTVRLEGET